MADVADSKSAGSNTVWVQVPLPAPEKILTHCVRIFSTKSVLTDGINPTIVG